MEKEKSIDVLNTLLEINNDRVEGYETASNETEEHDLKTMFAQFIRKSERCRNELTREILKLGGKPTDGTRVTGKFFRVWMDMKAALTNKDRKAILSSCEFGEDAAVNTYEKALKENREHLSAEQQTMVNAQYALIKADHDKVRSMRDMVEEHL